MVILSYTRVTVHVPVVSRLQWTTMVVKIVTTVIIILGHWYRLLSLVYLQLRDQEGDDHFDRGSYDTEL